MGDNNEINIFNDNESKLYAIMFGIFEPVGSIKSKFKKQNTLVEMNFEDVRSELKSSKKLDDLIISSLGFKPNDMNIIYNGKKINYMDSLLLSDSVKNDYISLDNIYSYDIRMFFQLLRHLVERGLSINTAQYIAEEVGLKRFTSIFLLVNRLIDNYFKLDRVSASILTYKESRGSYILYEYECDVLNTNKTINHPFAIQKIRDAKVVHIYKCSYFKFFELIIKMLTNKSKGILGYGKRLFDLIKESYPKVFFR